MNDSIRQKPEKSPKRCRQRDLKDNHWQSTVKPVWEHIVETKAHQTMKSNENKLKVFHKNILKPIVYQDPALLQLRAEKQKQRTEKTILKKHIDVKKDQQRREALKSGGPKTIMEVVKKAHLLGYAVSEIRKSSLEIYALNELMKTLENAEFQRFCNVAGIYPKE